MIQTGEGYNPFPTVRSPDALISFEVIPKAMIKENITAQTAASARMGNVARTLNGEAELSGKYGTLERFGWRLDGTYSLIPSSGKETGFWSTAVSGSDGAFGTPLVFRYEWDDPIDTFGWTLHFDAPGGVWASRVLAVAYDSEDNEVVRAEGVPDENAATPYGWSIQQFAADYCAVEFTFYGTNEPLRMLRLVEVDFGVSRRFSADSVTDMRIVYGTAIDASAFPAKELTFTFDNSDGEFNILSPAGVYQYWRNGQVLRAKVKIGDEVVNMGMFTESTAEIGKNRLLVKVRAHDQCYHLARQKYYPDASMTQYPSVTLKTAVEDVLAGYDLKVNYNGLEDELVSCQVNENHPKRTMLRYLAQAARCSVWIDRENTVQFKRFVQPTADELYDWSGVSISEEFTGCVLTVERELEETEYGQGTSYTYTSGEGEDTGTNTASYENPCIAPGKEQDVCDWLLAAANWRKKYAVKNRCDPAVEIGDALVIEDAFHNDDAAIVTGLDVTFDGVLSAVTEAAGIIGGLSAESRESPVVGSGTADNMILGA